MILVDTSVWIDHLRKSDGTLMTLLLETRVLIHPFVIGEIALGSLGNRAMVLEALGGLPFISVVSDEVVLDLVEHLGLHGQGIGYVDAHLLAATANTPGASLWTRDRRLLAAAERLALAAPLSSSAPR